jgi:hypothetical protein
MPFVGEEQLREFIKNTTLPVLGDFSRSYKSFIITTCDTKKYKKLRALWLHRFSIILNELRPEIFENEECWINSVEVWREIVSAVNMTVFGRFLGCCF